MDDFGLTIEEENELVGPQKCICGAVLEPATFKALDFEYKLVEITALSCPTKGCQGNIAQNWAEHIQKLREALNG